MTESFDPYLKWLGIRDPNRPVNHYRLLGLEVFENDPDVIASAAERQIKHVESYANGPHADACQLILTELEGAKSCLLNPGSRSAYDQQLRRQSTPPAIITQARARSQSPESETAPDIRPTIRAGRPRRKKSQAKFDIAGWILGAIGALAFAWVLLSTDLIDRIRGRVPENVSEEPVAELSPPSAKSDPDVSPKRASPEKRPTRPAATESKTEPQPPISKSASTNPEKAELKVVPPPMQPDPEPELTSSLPTNSEPVSTGKLPEPDGAELATAMKEIREQHRAQFNSADLRTRQLLAGTLLNNASNRRSDPLKQYAMLKLSSETASQSGKLDTLIAAIDRIDDRFETDFWALLTPLVEAGISANVDFEMMSSGLMQLFDRARADEKFDISEDIASRAARVARNQGDSVQEEMLSRFARDMKALKVLREQFEAIEETETPSENPKANLTVGRYLCYGKGDWENGLGFLSQGNDKTLAAVAKADLDSKGNALVADEWFKLQRKSKYKVLDRRMMCARAIEKLESLSNGGATSPEIENKMRLMRMETQVVKRFVEPPNGVRSHIFVFELTSPNFFDDAQFERGTILRLGLGQGPTRQERPLPVNKIGPAYLATTTEGKTNFKIRIMDTGIAEMRQYDAATGALLKILYGR
jgi:hypothetical protein